VNTVFNNRRHPVREVIGQSLLLGSLIAAVIYGGGWHPATEFWTVLVKGSAIGLMALFVLVAMQSFNHFVLFLALSVSVSGDVFLAIQGEASFMRGLLAFAAAHFLFIVLFVKNRMHIQDVSSLRIRLAALLWVAAAISAFFLYPELGDLLVPTMVYTGILILMATTALFSKFPIKLLGVGVILFVISDATLGAQKFLTVPDYANYIIWGCYYLAQLLITFAVILTDDRPTHYGGYRFD